MGSPVLTVDCVGLQCPAPILVLTKAANKATRPALLEVHADDGDFAIDVRAWCRSTGAVLKSLAEVDGHLVAQIALEGERTATDRPAEERAAAPPIPALQPVRIDVDCRGVRGPPVLHLDRVARSTIGAALLVVRSNEHQFPTALQGWCRSTGAELIHLDGGDGNYVATVGWGGARLPTAPAPEPRVATPGRKPPPERQESRNVALLVLRSDPASMSSALTVATSSAQSGMAVQVFLAHGGVNALRRSPPAVASWWSRWLGRPATPAAGIHGPAEQLHRAADLGIRFVVCGASLEAEGLSRGDLLELSTLEVGSLGEFASDARDAALSLVF